MRMGSRRNQLANSFQPMHSGYPRPMAAPPMDYYNFSQSSSSGQHYQSNGYYGQFAPALQNGGFVQPPPMYQNSPFQHQQPTYAPPPNQLTPQQLLKNPLQPQAQNNQNHYPLNQPVYNPYPKHATVQKHKTGSSIMNSFKGQDGSVDYNKMMNTAGQMMTAVNQMSGMVKGLGSIFKI